MKTWNRSKHTSASYVLVRFHETHAATPKGNLIHEAASPFQTRGLGISPGPSNKFVVHSAFAKHARNQFGATLHAKLYEDIAEMKLHCLFADLQTGSNLGIR